ncbi:MAG: fibronectin type III domain-containing protein, partial [Spirochaetota bacterium]
AHAHPRVPDCRPACSRWPGWRLPWAAVLLAAVAVQGCYTETDLFRYRSSAEVVQLQWDEPAGSQVTPTAYRVYYRRSGDEHWVLLGEARVDSGATYTLRYDDLGAGTYSFAVSAVYGGYYESPLHASTDEVAIPEGGWILIWQQ